MKTSKIVIWLIAAAWVSFSVAWSRAYEFGFSWSFAPSVLFAGLVLGFPAFVMLFVSEKGTMETRFKSCLLLLGIGFGVGNSFIAIEEYQFKQMAIQSGLEVFEQARSWHAFDDHVLSYYRGECTVFE